MIWWNLVFDRSWFVLNLVVNGWASECMRMLKTVSVVVFGVTNRQSLNDGISARLTLPTASNVHYGHLLNCGMNTAVKEWTLPKGEVLHGIVVTRLPTKGHALSNFLLLVSDVGSRYVYQTHVLPEWPQACSAGQCMVR
eukprot:3150583-Amphidinium_carterae.1